MLELVPVAVIAFVLGYGVREIVSRRRRRKFGRRRTNQLDPVELKLLKAHPRPERKRRSSQKKGDVNNPDVTKDANQV